MDADRRVRLHNGETLELGATLETAQLSIVISQPPVYLLPGGTLVVSLINNDPQLWDAQTGELVGGRFPNNPDVQPAGRSGFGGVITGVDDDLLLWNLDVESWPDIACQAAGRNLTLGEWDQFGPAGEPYNATCPQWPAAS